MPDLKIRSRQSLVSRDQLKERVRLVRMYVDLSGAFHDLTFAWSDRKRKGSDFEAILVLGCVFVGEADGRPTNVTKIAARSRLPRATIYRRLDDLIKLGKVIRVGRSYCLAENAVSPDRHGRLARILDEFRSK